MHRWLGADASSAAFAKSVGSDFKFYNNHESDCCSWPVHIDVLHTTISGFSSITRRLTTTVVPAVFANDFLLMAGVVLAHRKFRVLRVLTTCRSLGGTVVQSYLETAYRLSLTSLWQRCKGLWPPGLYDFFGASQFFVLASTCAGHGLIFHLW